MDQDSLSKKEPTPFHMDEKGTPYTPVVCSFPQNHLSHTYPEMQRSLEKYRESDVFDEQKYQADIRKSIDLKHSTTDKRILTLNKNTVIGKDLIAAMSTENLAVEELPPTLVQNAQPIS